MQTIKVALIEDDDMVRNSYVTLLHKSGYAVSAFADAEEFLQSACEYDCLLVDMRLPGMNGLELIEKLLAREDNPNQPEKLMLLTSGGPSEDLELQLDSPHVRLLSKPCPPRQVLELIASCREPR